jgi:hypothetical protein
MPSRTAKGSCSERRSVSILKIKKHALPGGMARHRAAKLGDCISTSPQERKKNFSMHWLTGGAAQFRLDRLHRGCDSSLTDRHYCR